MEDFMLDFRLFQVFFLIQEHVNIFKFNGTKSYLQIERLRCFCCYYEIKYGIIFLSYSLQIFIFQNIII